MPGSDRAWSTAVIVGAGRGTRFGAADKILAPLGGSPVIAWALAAAEACPSIESVVVVSGEHVRGPVQALVEAGHWTKIVAVVPGGERRQDSVAAGLAAVPAATTHVVIHDAARPFAAGLFAPCVAAATRCGAAVVATPVTDTLKRVEGSRIQATVARDGLWAVQTPQAFARDLLARGFAHAGRTGMTVTDEAGLMEALGEPVEIVAGDPLNIKITRPADLALAEALIAAGAIAWTIST